MQTDEASTPEGWRIDDQRTEICEIAKSLFIKHWDPFLYPAGGYDQQADERLANACLIAAENLTDRLEKYKEA